MGLDDLLISTGVDQMIRLVKEKGSIELGAAAKELKMPMRTVEDWAHVLEEEGLVKIEYKLTKIYLVWTSPTPEYIAKKSKKLMQKAGTTKDDIKSLLSKVEEGGKSLSSMQQELSKVGEIQELSPAELQKLRAQLSALDKKYSETLGACSAKFERLEKKTKALKGKITPEQGKGATEIEKELEVLHRFEDTLKSQLKDTETFFGAFEARADDFRKQIEDGRSDKRFEELKGEISQVKELKNELAGAVEAIQEEHKALVEKLDLIEKKVGEETGTEPMAAAKKRLGEIRKMEQDAKKQKQAVSEQLQDAISLLKKQSSKMKELAKREKEAEAKILAIKNEYVDIAEEISRANEELAKKQSSAADKIQGQLSALGKVKGGRRVSKSDIQKVSFMLRELKREQALLEGKVRLLLKESEIIKLGGTASGAKVPEPKEKGALVERVKLSKEEEGEFEKKRTELRALIRKMWEQSKKQS